MGNVKNMIFIKNFFLMVIKFLLITFIISSCGSSNDKELIKKNEKTDIEIYNKGLSLAVKGNHKKAIIEFDTLNNNYPYSSLTSKAEIMAAYSLYENNEIKKTIIKLKSFIEMNPSGEFSEYAHYLLAMCYYIQISNQGRDGSLTKKAINNFKILVSKYPNSKYAKDAKLKIQYINNSLALNELSIGVFYLNKNFPTAAIKRFKSIIENYKNTNVIPETLYRLCEALLMIGLEKEAKKSMAVLTYNFPKNEWTKLSKKLINPNSIEKNGMIKRFTNNIKAIFD